MRPLPFFPPPDRFRTIRMSDTPFQPTIVTGNLDLASALWGRRDALMLTAEQVDDLAGFQERYTAKLEQGDQPWGRGSLRVTGSTDTHPAGRVLLSFLGGIWLETLGLRLVVMSAEQAERLGAVPAPAPLSSAEKYRRGQSYRGHRKNWARA